MIREKIKQIFRELFPEAGKIEDHTSSADIRNWDSLRHVILISEVEKAFNIKFEIIDLLKMKTFGDICKMVEEKAKLL
jgi:acyl carrier protein